MTDLTTPLTTIVEAQAFIHDLMVNGKLFHFEDDPDTIINGHTGRMLFTEEEADLVCLRVNELYSFEWGVYDCPIGYALSIDPSNSEED